MKRKTKKKTKTINPIDEAAAFAVDQDIAVLLATLVQKLATFETKLDAILNRVTVAPTEAPRKPQVPAPVQPHIQPRPMEQRPGRPMYAVVCYECGEDSEIPFKPSGNRPVYCQACFAKRKNRPAKPSLPVLPTAGSPEPSRVESPKVSARKSKASKKVTPKKTPSAKKKTATKKKVAVKKKTVPKKAAKRKR